MRITSAGRSLITAMEGKTSLIDSPSSESLVSVSTELTDAFRYSGSGDACRFYVNNVSFYPLYLSVWICLPRGAGANPSEHQETIYFPLETCLLSHVTC